MLFNSYVFIFAFFPVVWLGFYQIGRFSHSFAALWLAVASVFFYGWWDVRYVSLLLGSIAFNYVAGYVIGQRRARNDKPPKLALCAAMAVNLSFLAYFKYANFFVDNLNHLAGTSVTLVTIILPLGISFFTFTQIAFLVDTYQGKVKEFNFVHYALFVTYFPHLIAGPILHHAEMMPQFARRTVCRINWENVAVGLSIFVLGLAKKVLIADSVADYSTPVFEAVRLGGQPMLIESWVGALAYTLQLYFDFSAYSDMAIGLSLMFNVRLPLNFNSPYKATSIIEFWRRWHMTLSRFLRDYLYIPLGGSRSGSARRYANLMITMLLGGLWHGAGWTFIIWGALHGTYLLINHAWRGLKYKMAWGNGGRGAALSAGTLTFLAVVVSWVFFRADSYASAVKMLQGMAGMHGVSLPFSLESRLANAIGLHSWLVFEGWGSFNVAKASTMLLIGFVIVWFLPNIDSIFRRHEPTCDHADRNRLDKPNVEMSGSISRIAWQPTTRIAALLGVLLFISMIIIGSGNHSEFLYFQF